MVGVRVEHDQSARFSNDRNGGGQTFRNFTIGQGPRRHSTRQIVSTKRARETMRTRHRRKCAVALGRVRQVNVKLQTLKLIVMQREDRRLIRAMIADEDFAIENEGCA